MKKKFAPKSTQRKSTTVRSIETAGAYAAVAGIGIPDHELTTFGPANVVRHFDLDEPLNGPSVIFREVTPFACFTRGYSDGVISDQDPGAATAVATADPKQALYPITSMANYFETDVFPILTNLFTSGTGTRYNSFTINEIVRFQAMMIEAYSWLLTPVIINKLVFHTDWKKIAPFTDAVPSFMYQLATNLGCTDVGLAETYLPLMRRMDNLTIFPRMAAEAKRIMTPMMSVDLHGRVFVPMRLQPDTITQAGVVAKVSEYLDYIDSKLVDISNLMATFLPFPFMDQDPWTLPDLPLIDIDRESGWFNSCTNKFSEFGDTGDPSKPTVMVCDEATDLNAVFYTRHCEPIWSEIKLSSIFWLEDDATDDTYRLITPHLYYDIHILDDAFDIFTYDGSAIGTGSTGFRYIDYASCRFASGDLDYGVQKPGLFGAHLGYIPLERMMRLETIYVFSVEVLKRVANVMAGASLREIRYTIRDLIDFGNSSPQ
jgi:hypothetical protein